MEKTKKSCRSNNSSSNDFFKKVKIYIFSLIGIIIFFIPTVLDFALSMVQGTKDAASKHEGCTTCMLDPFSEYCKPKNLTD